MRSFASRCAVQIQIVAIIIDQTTLSIITAVFQQALLRHGRDKFAIVMYTQNLELAPTLVRVPH